MTLKEVFSISGKPGLFKLVTNNKMPFIVEDLDNGKRCPVFPKDRIMALGDISIYTLSADKPLGEVFEAISAHYGDELPDEKAINKSGETLRTFMTAVEPDYDQERVHNSDIKKLLKWYLILRKSGMNTFVEPAVEEASEA